MDSSDNEKPLLAIRQDDDNNQTKYWPRSEKKYWIIALWFSCAFNYACRTVMPLCAPAISQEFGWSKTQTGIILSSFFWGYTLTQVLGGYLSDRINGEKVIFLAGVGWSALTFITPNIAHLFSSSSLIFFCIIVSRIVIGCLEGVHFPALTSITSQRVSEKEKSFTFTSSASGAQFGTILCGSIGSLLLSRYGWTSVFYFVGISALTWAAVYKFIMLDKKMRSTQILSLQENLVPGKVKKPLKVPWKLLFSKKEFWSIIIGQFCKNCAYYFLLNWLPTYFHDNYPQAKGWIFNVVPWLVNIPASICSGYIADEMIRSGFSITFVRKLMAVITLVGVGTCLLILNFTTTFTSALFCMAAALLFCGFHGGGILVNPQDIAPQFAGSVFGLMNTAGSIPGFLGVYVTGYLLDVWSSWAIVFTLTAFMCYLGCAVFLMFGTGKPVIRYEINL
ncbi:DgyrCDS1487 [Dimorphilus gyrociliatus]|uniref:DgyrCDS1487 n=1 Tax=Dimorphilus gyrociliatus TaxID=2664684 RepID=A0A7I8V9A7_9ANNE|nr:DgyrCDS1487 [Dimorphilus gyrociliatus]